MRTGTLNNPLAALSAIGAGTQAAGNFSATAGDIITGAANFLSTCKGNCWAQYPPFSGKGAQRGACFVNCQRQAAMANTPGGGYGRSKSAALPLIGAAFLAYALINKKR